MRRVVIVPKDEIPYERREGGRRFNRDRRDDRPYGERREGGRKFNRDRRNGPYGERREDFGGRRGRDEIPRSSAPRGKKQIFLGTYLGNSNDSNGGGNNDNSDNNNE